MIGHLISRILHMNFPEGPFPRTRANKSGSKTVPFTVNILLRTPEMNRNRRVGSTTAEGECCSSDPLELESR